MRAVPRAVPTVVLTLGAPTDLTREVRDALHPRADVRAVADLAGVRAELTRTVDTCVVVTVPSDPHDALWETIRALRRQFPSIPVVAIALVGHSSLQGAWRLGRAEVSDLVTVGDRLDADDFRIALARVHADGLVARVWERARLRLPDPLVTIVRRALRLAHAPFTAADLAEASQLHERSLRKYCERHRLPAPQQLVGWTRLLLASYHLDEGGRALHEVAELLGFSTPGALRKLIARYTGHSSSSLRAIGALDHVSRALEHAVSPVPRAPELRLVRGT